MPLSQFPSAMDAAASAVIGAAAAMRVVRDGTGDLTFRELSRVQSGLRAAKAATVRALAEGHKATAAAETHMASVGGPATLAEFQIEAAAIEVQAAVWNVALADTLAALTSAELVELATDTSAGVAVKVIRFLEAIPEAKAAPLRDGLPLAELIAAFEAVGA